MFDSSEPMAFFARLMSPTRLRSRGCTSESVRNLEISTWSSATRGSISVQDSISHLLTSRWTSSNLPFDSQVRTFHLLMREMVPLLRPDGGGRVIAISYSPSGRTGSWQPWCAMGAAKAAVDALSRYYAVALGPRGVTVNVISPGATDDSVLSRLPAEVFGMIRDWHEGGWTPMRRMGTPVDIGNAVAMLCTDQASFITGQTIHVDGGASVMDPVFPLAVQGIS